MKTKQVAVALVASFIATGTFDVASAQSTPPDSTMQGMPLPASPSKDFADGEVRKIDKDARKITLKHGAIPNLEMPGMTMVFQVKEPGMLDTVKVGDKVRFQAQKIGGAMVVTDLQAAK